MNSVIHRRFTTTARILALTVLSAAGVLLIIFRYIPVSPDGTYYDKCMANVGPAYWIFKDGNVLVVTPESTNLISTYSKVGGDWFYHTRTNASTILKTTVLGMTMVTVDAGHTNVFYVPRRYLSWL